MNHKKLITIITPTYNRQKCLIRLYNSLKNQTSKNFIWMIIDDGSEDDTEEYVKQISSEQSFFIKYLKKINGGKHRAINFALENIKTDLVFIVDSDDFLIENSVQSIEEIHEKYKNNNNLAGYVFLKGFSETESVTSKFNNEECIENYNKYIINKNFKGDKAEVFKSSVLCKYRFDEFEGEKFLGEGYLWSKISENYNMVFINKIIYICEYLEDGLTKSGKKLRINNPLGGMIHAKQYLKHIFRPNIVFKNMLLYIIYSKFAKFSFKKSYNDLQDFRMLYIFIYPLGVIIYKFWKLKYL